LATSNSTCSSAPPRVTHSKPSIKNRIKEMLPDWFILVRKYVKAHAAFPNIISPVTFNEKVLCRTLFDRRPLLTRIADKAAVRSYVESRLGHQILPKLYHLTTRPDTIPFDELPDRFVVKPTHGSGWVQLVTNKATLDRTTLIKTCADWLKRSYYKETREILYRDIEPRIIVEEFIDDGSGTAPIDYKLFVFGGTVELIQVDAGRFTGHRRLLYTPDWEKLDVRLEYDKIPGDVPRPAHLGEMIAAAETIGRDWDFIRADFYDTAVRLYFGELTLTPEAGNSRFHPKAFDRYLGGLWCTRSSPPR
jgi:TupA-like ATPgrasp